MTPDNPRYVMGGSYLGTIDVLDMKSKASTQVMAAPIQYLGREARNMKYLYIGMLPPYVLSMRKTLFIMEPSYC